MNQVHYVYDFGLLSLHGHEQVFVVLVADTFDDERLESACHFQFDVLHTQSLQHIGKVAHVNGYIDALTFKTDGNFFLGATDIGGVG